MAMGTWEGATWMAAVTKSTKYCVGQVDGGMLFRGYCINLSDNLFALGTVLLQSIRCTYDVHSKPAAKTSLITPHPPQLLTNLSYA